MIQHSYAIPTTSPIVAKAVKQGFFLGLDDKWLTIRKKRVRVKASEKKVELDKVAA